MRVEKLSKGKTVLVGVLKNKRDLQILLKEHWYRIPVSFFPKREFSYVAFYQPAIFGRGGRRIKYYARAVRMKAAKRIDLIPNEPDHPRAQEEYMQILFRKIRLLPKPIRNIVPRRISFGFTDLGTLLNARDILELYSVPPTEQILERRLASLGISTVPEYRVSGRGHRYRIDLAVLCVDGKIAIECDNDKAHSSKIQKKRDKAKDAFLKRNGWHVVRLSERDIIENLDSSVDRIIKLL